MKDVLVNSADFHDDYVKLEYDLIDGKKTNFSFRGAVIVDFVSSGEMTEDEFRQMCINKIMSIK